MDSFQFKTGDQVLIAVQRAHEVPKLLDQRLRLSYPEVTVRWIEIDTLLPGQLSTATVALKRAKPNPNQPLLIHNCDTGFQWQDNLLPSSDAYGSMAVFPATGDHWSFGKPDPRDPNKAIAIAEKKRISNLASIGLYGFKSVGIFLSDAHKQLRTGETVKGILRCAITSTSNKRWKDS